MLKICENARDSRECKNVEELDVSGTAIRDMSSSIGLLKNLKRLSLEGCRGLSSSNKSGYELIRFYSKPISPDPMGLSHLLGLCSLTRLNLRDCNLNAIPNAIGSLFSLEYLNLSENNLKCLPESIGQLTRLFDLDLRKNNLKCLPESLGQLSELGFLLLCENDFVRLPKSIYQLSFLREMVVSDCTYLKSLPKLPLNIGIIRAEDVPWPYLQNCFKLSENQGFIDYFISFIKRQPQVSLSLSLSLSR